MRIAKPLLLITTPIGVAMGSVILTIRRERTAEQTKEREAAQTAEKDPDRSAQD